MMAVLGSIGVILFLICVVMFIVWAASLILDDCYKIQKFFDSKFYFWFLVGTLIYTIILFCVCLVI